MGVVIAHIRVGEFGHAGLCSLTKHHRLIFSTTSEFMHYYTQVRVAAWA
jgi:hypothetical protein